MTQIGLKLAQKKYPKFKTIIQEESGAGELIMTMVFESAETPYKIWAEPARQVRDSVCVRVCMCVCVYVCACMNVCMCTYVYVYVFCMNACM